MSVKVARELQQRAKLPQNPSSCSELLKYNIVIPRLFDLLVHFQENQALQWYHNSSSSSSEHLPSHVSVCDLLPKCQGASNEVTHPPNWGSSKRKRRGEASASSHLKHTRVYWLWTWLTGSPLFLLMACLLEHGCGASNSGISSMCTDTCPTEWCLILLDGV